MSEKFDPAESDKNLQEKLDQVRGGDVKKTVEQKPSAEEAAQATSEPELIELVDRVDEERDVNKINQIREVKGLEPLELTAEEKARAKQVAEQPVVEAQTEVVKSAQTEKPEKTTGPVVEAGKQVDDEFQHTREPISGIEEGLSKEGIKKTDQEELLPEEIIAEAQVEKKESEKMTPDEVMLAETDDSDLILSEDPEDIIAKAQAEKGALKKENKMTPDEVMSVESQGLEAGALKTEADNLLQDVLEKQGELQRIQNRRGLFRKAQNILGSSDQKEGHINKEFKDAKEALRLAGDEYRAKCQEFASKVVEDKKAEIGSGENKAADLRKFILTGKVVEGVRKNEKGEAEKLTLFDYMNQNEKRLIGKRLEVLNEKKKGVFQKYREWHGKRPGWQKLALSVALSAAIGAGAGAALGGGLAAAASCFGGKFLAEKAGQKLLMMTGVGSVVGATAGVLNWDKENLKNKNKEISKVEIAERLENGFDDIFESLDYYNKQLRRKEGRNRILVSASAATAVLALGQFDIDDLNAKMNEVDFNGKTEPTDAAQEAGGKIDFGGKTEPTRETGPGVALDPGGASQETLARMQAAVDQKEVAGDLLNEKFALKPGGSVWASLSDHYSGDRQQIGKALTGFRAEAMKDLVDNKGMTEAQAGQFMDWRYRHMDIGAQFELKDGKLDIPGFVDDSQIKGFEKSLPGMNLSEEIQERITEQDKARQEAVERAKTSFDDIKTVDTDETADVDLVSPTEMKTQIDGVVEPQIKEIYDGWGRSQLYEWDVMKDKLAVDIVRRDYGAPIIKGFDGMGHSIDEEGIANSGAYDASRSQLDQAEINNREGLREYVVALANETKLLPRDTETVEEFIRRAEWYRVNEG